jgi:DNA-binding FrmR family transcriptional regulator
MVSVSLSARSSGSGLGAPTVRRRPVRGDTPPWYKRHVAHTVAQKAKLLNRVRRLRGQLSAVEKALDGEHECSSVLHTLAACRGAINALMAELVEGHIRFHVLDPKEKLKPERAEAAEQLVALVNAYLK